MLLSFFCLQLIATICVITCVHESSVPLLCRPQDAKAAKYELVTTVRTHLGSEDDAFGCMGVAEDADGVQASFLYI